MVESVELVFESMVVFVVELVVELVVLMIGKSGKIGSMMVEFEFSVQLAQKIDGWKFGTTLLITLKCFLCLSFFM